jgi:hypothetical protein
MNPTNRELRQLVAQEGYLFMAGILAAICKMEGRESTAKVAFRLGAPLFVALYAVRVARGV